MILPCLTEVPESDSNHWTCKTHDLGWFVRPRILRSWFHQQETIHVLACVDGNQFNTVHVWLPNDKKMRKGLAWKPIQPTSPKVTLMASYENQPRTSPCAFAASELLIASAQCSIEDREWSWPEDSSADRFRVKKWLENMLSIKFIHMTFTLYTSQETIHIISILVRHPSITDFHLFAFSCLHLSIYPSTYLYLTVTLNDIHYSYHTDTHTSCPTGKSADAANVRVKRRLYTIIWTSPSERMPSGQTFTRL